MGGGLSDALANPFVDSNAVSTFTVTDANWLQGKSFYCVQQLGGGEEIEFLSGNTKALWIEFGDSGNAFSNKESHTNGTNDVENFSGTYTFDAETLKGVLTCTGEHSFYEEEGGTNKITDFPFTLSNDGKTLTFSVEVERAEQRGMYTCVWKLTNQFGKTVDEEFPSSGRTALWENSNGKDFAYWSSADETRWVRVHKKGFAQGDKIIITYTKSPTFSKYQTIQMAGAYHDDWNQTYLRGGDLQNAYAVDGGDDKTEYNIVPYDEEGYVTYELTSADAGLINQNYGLAVFGCGVTVTGVYVNKTNGITDSLESIDVPTTAQSLYENFDLDDWESYLKLYYKNFSQNDTIYISYKQSSLNPGREDSIDCKFKIAPLYSSYWDSDALKDGTIKNGYVYGGNGIHVITADSAEKTVSYVLTQSDAENLNSKRGIVIWGGCLQITSVKVQASLTLETSLETVPDGTVTVYEGENDFGCWSKKSNTDSTPLVEGGDVWMRLYYKGFKAGDQIWITHEESDIWNGYYRIKMCGINSTWDNTILKGGLIDNGAAVSGSIEPITPTQATGYTLTAADAANLNNSDGLVIMACGLKITKVDFKSASELSSQSFKNGWHGNEYGGGLEVSNEQLTFTKRLKKYGYFDDVGKKAADNYKEFKFDYTYNSTARELAISKAYKVEYEFKGEVAEGGNPPDDADCGNSTGSGTVLWYKTTKTEITGFGSFTASWTLNRGNDDGAGIKFDSVPSAGDLNKYFVEGVWYDFSDNPAQLSIGVKDENGSYFDEPLEIEKGNSLTLSVSFERFDSEPTSLSVWAYRENVDGSDVAIASGAAVSEGKISFTVPNSLSAGLYRVFVKDEGSGIYGYGPQILVTDPALPRSVTISLQSQTVAIGDNMVLNVNFTNFDINPSVVELRRSGADDAGNVSVSNGKITLPTITAAAGDYAIYVVADGVQSNEVTVTLVAAATPESNDYDPNAPKLVLWKGSNDFGGNDASTDTTKIVLRYTNFSVGDKIVVTHTNSSSAPNANKHQFKLYGADDNFFKTGAVSSNATMDDGKIKPNSYVQTTAYTLTAADLQSINVDNQGHGGMGMEGSGLAITEIAVQRVDQSQIILADCALNGWQALMASATQTSAEIAFTSSLSDLMDAAVGTDLSSLLKWYEFEFTVNGSDVTVTKISEVPWTCVDGNDYDIKQDGKKFKRGSVNVEYQGSWSATSGGLYDFAFCFNELPSGVQDYLQTGVYYPIKISGN